MSGDQYAGIEKCRNELLRLRTYYLDPRTAMRRAATPAEVEDIGVLGENIAPFLFRLRTERAKHFDAVVRTLRSLIPSVESVSVDLDKRRGTLDVVIRQGGIEYSSRIVSEGTLRVLALCAITSNPWGGSVIAFEEPENGVHPRRVESIAELLMAIAVHQNKQVIVTTHSTLFCAAVWRLAKEQPGDVALLRVSQEEDGSRITPFETADPLFSDSDIKEALASPGEDALLEGLLIRGLLDG